MAQDSLQKELVGKIKMKAAYADESGNAGFEGDGASTHFVFGFLIPQDDEGLIDRVAFIRRKLQKPATFEFHFRHVNERVRQAFFETLQTEQLSLYLAVIHKRLAPKEFQQQGKLGLYAHSVAGLVLRADAPFSKIKLHIDGTGSQKHFLQMLRTEVRQRCQIAKRPQQNFQEIRLLNSTHALIQCADMFTSACAQKVKFNSSPWWTMIEPKLKVWWEEPFRKENPSN